MGNLPLLVDAIRRDVRGSGGSDAARRLFLVPRAHVVALHTTGGVVHRVEVDVGGQRESLAVGPGCAVVLAASAIESTRLALRSFPSSLMGRCVPKLYSTCRWESGHGSDQAAV